MITDRERADPFEAAIRTAIAGAVSKLWTAIPGIIESYDPTKNTVSIQPAIQVAATAADGTISLVTMPLLLDCPVYFPRGGRAVVTLPIAKGDECLAVFATRCIDSWWQSGGVQPQAELRMHDLSDGFAFVGFSSLPNVPDDISLSYLDVRSAAGVLVTSPDLNASGNIAAGSGANGSFTTPTGQVITVRGGIITNIG